MNPSPRKALHVVAAAIINPQGEILIAQRPRHLHQGGLWEFPGGKLEPGESRWQGVA
ncbi:MAG: NUDIX domain-containing protein, partial [Gammaproteobacteria bacterium]|nr:NUDIX domain-containing protein [Gammaproteobacteria bacterium]